MISGKIFSVILTGCIVFTAIGIQRITSAESLEKLDAKEIVRKVETQYQGTTSHATARMKVVTESWSRELSMEMWSKGRDQFLARILTPKKEEGTATLKIGDEIWNYLPKIDRLMKIPSSLMGDSWMGSHLTNDDLVKENKIDELYDVELGNVEGSEVTIICIPKSEAAVVWGKIEYLIDVEKMIPVRVLYFDEDGVIVRTMTFDQVKRVSDRWIPLHMVVKPEEEPNEMTELIYDNLEFDIKLDKDQFTIRAMRGK